MRRKRKEVRGERRKGNGGGHPMEREGEGRRRQREKRADREGETEASSPPRGQGEKAEWGSGRWGCKAEWPVADVRQTVLEPSTDSRPPTPGLRLWKARGWLQREVQKKGQIVSALDSRRFLMG